MVANMSQNTTRELVAESLARAGLVPGAAQDLIPSDFKPTVSLEVSFVDKVVGLGGVFRANECKITPAIAFKPEVSSSNPITLPQDTDARICRPTKTRGHPIP